MARHSSVICRPESHSLLSTQFYEKICGRRKKEGKKGRRKKRREKKKGKKEEVKKKREKSQPQQKWKPITLYYP